eukprot:jgi/Ulvmu1/842/UM010_0216.1
MWQSQPYGHGDTVDWKFQSQSSTTWVDVEHTFKGLTVQQRDGASAITPRESTGQNGSNGQTVLSMELSEGPTEQTQPSTPLSSSREPEDIINDLDAYRVFLGRCNDAETAFKIFVLLSSPGLKDTSWGPLKCSEAQVAVYEGAITPASLLVFVTHCVPDSYMAPSTQLLRQTAAPFHEHVATIHTCNEQVWDRARIECAFSAAFLQQAQLEAQQDPAPELYGNPHSHTTWPAMPNPPFHSMHGNGAMCGGGKNAAMRKSTRPGHTPIPHVHGISSWKGPPMKLDPAEKQLMKAQLVEAIRASRASAQTQRPAAGSSFRAAPMREQAAGAATGGAGREPLSPAAPTFAASLLSSGSSSHSHMPHMHGAGPQPLRAPFPSSGAEAAKDPIVRFQARGVSQPPIPGFLPPSTAPGRRHDPNASCGDARWTPCGGGTDLGAGGAAWLDNKYLAPAPRSAPARAYATRHRPLESLAEAPGFGGSGMGYDTASAIEDAMARAMADGLQTAARHKACGGMLGAAGGLAGDGPPPVVPPQQMARLLTSMAEQLGYPPQRMHDVLSCMQQDCMQAVSRAVSW